MRRYLTIYKLYTLNSFIQALANPITFVIFFLGKLIRISVFSLSLIFMFSSTSSLAGYTQPQIIFFYLSFVLVDSLSQFFFREVYRFRPLLLSGDLDLVLTKPVNPLLRVLFGGADVIDLATLGIIFIAVFSYGTTHFFPSLANWAIYLLLIACGLIIAAALNIWVLGLGVITISVDHFIWIYRDLSSMLRIPVDFYPTPIRLILTFVIPLGVMITFPAKAFLGLLSPQTILITCLFSCLFCYLSLRFWHFALRSYSSASS